MIVLNLVINGYPSILLLGGICLVSVGRVLNLVINGYPSIPAGGGGGGGSSSSCFKPCYKWIPFNTLDLNKNIDFMTFCFNF